ncbi:efflux RND transporter periplasmic adaptor subunit [Aurantimonas endophytica]|uniref:Multidrug efflux system membrane fusion protein n=1 Tax=Aurantimonas endophytica TaxID=1522175 RepID=A0A7W6HHK4_9HYPH|nr:efflux RND transporter periplasmic adaptor subunit [Aurantimonas endophytica]MBB4005384.1 multidrug efflux system membrane fusion protein [Aurantimonas endophytica]MCO6405955.1 efflux RND transporter periplasmic adaptor subunit [Aurantimonas endophytica]
MPKLSRCKTLSMILLALPLAACGKGAASPGDEAAGPATAEVSVIEARSETITLFDELPGRVAAFRTAEIRPQVGGIIEKRLFEDGAEVAVDQPLFRINPAPFEADVAIAAAALQRAEAILRNANEKFERARALVERNTASRASSEAAAADVAQADAGVAEAAATLRRRQVDLDLATVRSPIAGQVGLALASEGALVSTSSTSALANVQQIDRIYVDLRQPASQIDTLNALAASGALEDASAVPVPIVMASGKPYPHAGRALFFDTSVDPSTGNVTVRVEVSNPERLLLPGMYVRARLPRGIRRDAILVPQEAVVRDPGGGPQLVVLDADGQGARRDVTLGETVKGRTIVASGLKAGESVVVLGQDRVADGVTLTAVPFVASQPRT